MEIWQLQRILEIIFSENEKITSEEYDKKQIEAKQILNKCDGILREENIGFNYYAVLQYSFIHKRINPVSFKSNLY